MKFDGGRGREEEGIYYGVNLRSKDFLMLSARLGGNKSPISDLHRQEVPFPPHVLQSSTSQVLPPYTESITACFQASRTYNPQSFPRQEVFDFVASKVAEFVAAHPGDRPEKPGVGKGLGFAVSYPVGHSATEFDSGSDTTAIKWKSFLADDPVEFSPLCFECFAFPSSFFQTFLSLLL